MFHILVPFKILKGRLSVCNKLKFMCLGKCLFYKVVPEVFVLLYRP